MLLACLHAAVVRSIKYNLLKRVAVTIGWFTYRTHTCNACTHMHTCTYLKCVTAYLQARTRLRAKLHLLQIDQLHSSDLSSDLSSDPVTHSTTRTIRSIDRPIHPSIHPHTPFLILTSYSCDPYVPKLVNNHLPQSCGTNPCQAKYRWSLGGPWHSLSCRPVVPTLPADGVCVSCRVVSMQ